MMMTLVTYPISPMTPCPPSLPEHPQAEGPEQGAQVDTEGQGTKRIQERGIGKMPYHTPHAMKEVTEIGTGLHFYSIEANVDLE